MFAASIRASSRKRAMPSRDANLFQPLEKYAAQIFSLWKCSARGGPDTPKEGLSVR